MTDEQLFANAAADKYGVMSDRNKYTALLISKYIPLIKSKAYSFKSKNVETEDLISEGFLGLLSAIRSYNPEKGSFSAFASVCIMNKMRSAVAKSSDGLQKMSSEDFPIEEISDGNLNTEDLIILKEQNNEVIKQMETLLSPLEREAFYLYLSAYSYNQIAERLNISAKSADNAITRAKSKLRGCFKDKDSEQ